jgi:hypothetical protein
VRQELRKLRRKQKLGCMRRAEPEKSSNFPTSHHHFTTSPLSWTTEALYIPILQRLLLSGPMCVKNWESCAANGCLVVYVTLKNRKK